MAAETCNSTKGHKNIIFWWKITQTILISLTNFPDGLLEDQRSPVGMAKDLPHLHSCVTDIYKLETYFVAK